MLCSSAQCSHAASLAICRLSKSSITETLQPSLLSPVKHMNSNGEKWIKTWKGELISSMLCSRAAWTMVRWGLQCSMRCSIAVIQCSVFVCSCSVAVLSGLYLMRSLISHKACETRRIGTFPPSCRLSSLTVLNSSSWSQLCRRANSPNAICRRFLVQVMKIRLHVPTIGIET